MSRIRKHLKKKLFEDIVAELDEGQEIVRCIGHRGSNQIEVEFPGSKEIILVMIPKKFQNLIMIKNGDFVIIKYDRSSHNIGKIKGIVVYLLIKDTIKMFKKAGLFPKEFLPKLEENEEKITKNEEEKKDENENDGKESEEDESEEDDDEENKINNPNRINYDDDNDEILSSDEEDDKY